MLATLGCLLCSQFLGKTRAAVKEALSGNPFQEADEISSSMSAQAKLKHNLAVLKLLAVFSLILIVLVTVVSLAITWNNEDDAISFAELPMFQPLMWIAVAASVELLTRSPNFTQDIPVPEGKTVFPHDASDFELIRQHGHEYLNCTLTYRISHVLRSR
ncbi:hypothetical protein PF005_g20025 [Phytophthora fragariae]|uniref:Uncharacterized protein n=2 Tax=Phytophthora fragariae TaxID=53985 RepID=A0A6A3XGT1_9STRA|nr:hypothetical protein PF011_g18912 [Phytophthora fragariae]KAE9086167.1 hypothetical protein PF010_g20192 [Phytophthora fragariae]KAE9088186.1 hypothetical protein PF007_g20068 [Phytophthora fragariae]KAE9188530.1 hypothetical protein PF005_g20025 [Phytophthora fragariae]KAE9202431.1 hypothetical protein PF002_g21243 [Phytophthora fragariae]